MGTDAPLCTLTDLWSSLSLSPYHCTRPRVLSGTAASGPSPAHHNPLGPPRYDVRAIPCPSYTWPQDIPRPLHKSSILFHIRSPR